MKWKIFSLGIILLMVLIVVGAFFAGSIYGQQQAQKTRTVTRLDGTTIAIPVGPQANFGNITSRAVEQLHDDELIRSNLTDDETKVVLDWGISWIEEQVASAKDESSAEQNAQSALSRVHAVISQINTLSMQPGELRLADAISALEPSLNIDQSLSRARYVKLLTILASATWRIQEE